MTLWERREAKRNWAANNPDKVRQANRNWRRSHQTRYNQAARARMQRYRARLNATTNLEGSSSKENS